MIRSGVVRALARRDALALARAPRGYVVASLYLLLQGFLFGVVYLRAPGSAYRDLARVLVYAWVVLAPALAGGSLAGEREVGELGALQDEPIGEGELVAGKALTLAGLVVLLAGSYALPAALAAHLAGTPPAVLACAGLGLTLVALTATGLGVLASAVAGTTASAIALGVSLVALCGGGASWLGRGQEVGDPLWLLEPFLRGVLDARPVLLLPAMALGALMLAARVLAAVRVPPPVDPETGARRSVVAELGTWSLRILRGLGPVAAILALVVAGSSRLDLDWDLSGYLELSPATVTRLRHLTQDVELFVVPSTEGRRPIDDLLDQVVRAGQGRVRLSPLDRDTFQARLRPLGLLVPPPEGMVVRIGEEVRAVGSENLDVRSGAAEATLEAAIGALMAPADSVTMLFTEGHRERPLTPQPMDGPISLATWVALLEVEGIRARSVWLPESGDALTTSSVLAVIGPRDPFTEPELARLRSHASAGGPVLLALDPEHPETNGPLLEAVGMRAEVGLLVSPTGTLAGAGATSLLLAPKAGHPLGALLDHLRVVVPGAMGLTGGEPLLETPAEAQRIDLGGDPRDRRSWRERGVRAVAMTRTAPGRVVVIGDADLTGDGAVTAHPGNGLFLGAAACWLADRPPPASSTRVALRTRTPVSREELARLTRWVGVAPTALVLLAGLLSWLGWRRRSGGASPPGAASRTRP